METQKLLDDYTSWLRLQFKVNTMEDNSDEISTPFVNSINDNIRFYVTQLNKNKIKLDDDGETLNNLLLSGIDINSTQRQIALDSIIENFQLSLDDEILSISGKPIDFPQMKQNFINAIIEIDAMSMFKKRDISKLFMEEIYKYLDEKDFGGLPKYRLSGQSGNEYRIDYAIPANHAKNKPMRLIDFQNSINFNKVAVAAYKYKDIRQLTDKPDDVQFAIIFNDKENRVPQNAINVAKDSGIELYEWSNPIQLESSLK